MTSGIAKSAGNRTEVHPAWIQTTGGPLNSSDVWRWFPPLLAIPEVTLVAVGAWLEKSSTMQTSGSTSWLYFSELLLGCSNWSRKENRQDSACRGQYFWNWSGLSQLVKISSIHSVRIICLVSLCQRWLDKHGCWFSLFFNKNYEISAISSKSSWRRSQCASRTGLGIKNFHWKSNGNQKI